MTMFIKAQPLTADAFAPFGDVLAPTQTPDKIINEGRCRRYHDRAQLDFSDGRAGISIFQSDAVSLPYTLTLMERHPAGSQAFVPMSADPFLVIAAPDAGGMPGEPCAFITAPGQGINLHRGIWHGVLTPLAAPGIFAVIDRIGDGANLQEHRFDEGYIIDG